MHIISIFTLAFAAAAATPARAALLRPRCQPIPDHDLPRGYLPPAPCWQDFDTACQPHTLPGTQTTVDPEHRRAVVTGVPASCADEIRLEQARAAEGLKTYGWEKKYGRLSLVGDGATAQGQERGAKATVTLVIEDMPPSAVEALQKLKPKGS